MGRALPHKVSTAEHKDVRRARDVSLTPSLARWTSFTCGGDVSACRKRVVMMRLWGSMDRMWEGIVRGVDDS